MRYSHLFFYIGLSVSAAFAQTAPTADNFTAVKGNKVVGIHDASNVSYMKIENGEIVTYNANNNPVFSQSVTDIDHLSLEEVPAINRTVLGGDDWKVARIDLQHGQMVEFTDVSCIYGALQPHFFTDITPNSAKFTGITGSYDFHFNERKGLSYIMNPEMAHPDALWICGEGFGHPSNWCSNDCSWAMDQVEGTPMAKKISDGVFEITLYLDCDFKFLFFKTRGDWNSSLNRLAVATYPEDVFSIGYFDDENTGYGHFTGDFVPGKNFTPGVYSLQIDTNKGVGVVVGQASLDDIQGAPRKINGVKLTNTYEGYVGAELHLTQGEEVTFEGIAMLDKALHPDYFDVLDGKAYFKAASGRYILNYKTDRGIVYCEPADVNQGLWITGQGLGHPCQSLASYDYCNWGFENPKDYIVLPEVSTGVYQGTVLLGNQPDLVNWEHNGYRFGFQFQIYDGKANWNSNYGATTCDIVAEGDARVGLAAADFFNFLPLPGFTPGLYNIKVDTNNHSEGKRATVTFTRANGGYLFAFMTNANYGKLFYAVSRDCYNWRTLNDGQIIDPEYIGHPDIERGPDGVFHMIAVKDDGIYHWTSSDLVSWNKNKMDNRIIAQMEAAGFYITYYYGAPKLFYDKDSEQFIMTWHACKKPYVDDWDTMTTLYTLTKDFKTFSYPQVLFNFTGEYAGMPIIDTLIRKVGDKYYAITKDERDHEKSPVTGKCILLCKSDNLTGPYTNPIKSVTPNDLYREAPIWVELPDNGGFAIYAESYQSNPLGYRMFVNPTDNPENDWEERSFNVPSVDDGTDRPNARHGCIVKVNEQIYKKLKASF